uniref:Small ribosomal subunit protein uS19c n=1 Tax=Pelargonium cotyledonis TaxID=28968 RepID=A0A0G2YMJ3_9ROSI|nr:ribosomal protein S19 [Pelargonium cotyledonis]
MATRTMLGALRRTVRPDLPSTFANSRSAITSYLAEQGGISINPASGTVSQCQHFCHRNCHCSSTPVFRRALVPSSLSPSRASIRLVHGSSKNVSEKDANQATQESLDSTVRSIWKNPFVDNCLLRIKDDKARIENVKIWSRRSTILPEFVGSTVQIYNGKQFVRVKITDEKVGHKFGEFAPTRSHNNNNKKKVVQLKKGKKK